MIPVALMFEADTDTSHRLSRLRRRAGLRPMQMEGRTGC
jgi:hypothetical protein